MGSGAASGTRRVALYLLWFAGCAAQKVYFDCGAKVDVVDVQGLILSPGFPYNYSSGTHCVWQFFVPVGHQLIMEMFDFDVFESHSSQTRLATLSEVNMDNEMMDDGMIITPLSSSVEDSTLLVKSLATQGSTVKEPQAMQKDEEKQVVVQEQSTKMEMAKVVSNSAKWSPSSSSAPPLQQLSSEVVSGADPVGGKAQNSVSPQALQGEVRTRNEATLPPPSPTETEPESLGTQQSALDACPHDVLYISDLITFSSRFCGANRPASSQLVFGSSEEMVEVIMELITTTHWGRGFALLFQYRNHTELGENPQPLGPTARKMDALMAILSGGAFFIVALTSVLCVIFRPKLCAKGASASFSSNTETPERARSPGVDASELQLVPPEHLGQEVTLEKDNNNLSSSPVLPHSGSPAADVSHSRELETSSSGLTELELGTDEVFVISSGPSPSRLPFCAHTQRERFLRHSDTGPSHLSDWPSPEPSAQPAAASPVSPSSTRPRAWSVRTFQDLLPPLPQLHKKWCSWNSTSPFTKLVDSAPANSASDYSEDGKRKVLSDVLLGVKGESCYSDSSMSNASYPLSQPAQRQRRLNSISNLRRSRFTAPCFGLLSGASDSAKVPTGSSGPPVVPQVPEHVSRPAGQLQAGEAQGGKGKDFPGGDDHSSVPVFAISEEEDRQPLVLAEHLTLPHMQNGLKQESQEGRRPADCSPNLQCPVNGSLRLKGRSEWRPWVNSSSGAGGLLSPGAAAAATAEPLSTSSQIQLPSPGQSSVQCSLMGKDM
ncbi:uncharacterized protein LOC114799471 [Denticeps clupeoides]|uniref:uncharacterized protein LOC114799471 n=1 Tax=Denticeps clupeoides TaxID=299321 RepID=UPI0010A3B44F|nr:uncharacterized protein LOC114799471 [Denticeps clupeoides]